MLRFLDMPRHRCVPPGGPVVVCTASTIWGRSATIELRVNGRAFPQASTAPVSCGSLRGGFTSGTHLRCEQGVVRGLPMLIDGHHRRARDHLCGALRWCRITTIEGLDDVGHRALRRSFPASMCFNADSSHRNLRTAAHQPASARADEDLVARSPASLSLHRLVGLCARPSYTARISRGEIAAPDAWHQPLVRRCAAGSFASARQGSPTSNPAESRGTARH